MIELERTFLVGEIPNLFGCRSTEIIDIFIPQHARHPSLRLRKICDSSGCRHEMTKKKPVGGDSSEQEEQTIALGEEEYNALSKISGKRLSKTRHYYDWNGKTAEIDVYHEGLEGLVTADFEFDSKEEKETFKKPEFCLADVTREEFIAGGMLCGKKYKDIESELEKFGYNKIKTAQDS